MEGLGISNRMTYLGHVGGQRTAQVWAAADAFALPSYSEGFSMAILEALACSLPCLITTSCHFPELESAGGAIVVEPRTPDVTQGLRELLERTDLQRKQLGEIGRRLVESQYTWGQQARQLESVYHWLAGGGPVPGCILP
jgi:glycosyltransferase involved in cell wall biosynthesis